MSEVCQDYKIKLRTFEGPMELLMHLIEKSKIDIYDIPVAELTEQYLAYLDSMRSLDMEIASDFLVMAAKLLLIKSRMILPQLKSEEDEEEEDPRDELVRRVLEYKRFKEAGSFLERMAELQQGIFYREPLKQAVSHVPPKNLLPAQLIQAMQDVLAIKPEPEIPSVIVEMEHYSLQTQMELILHALSAVTGLYFSELLRSYSREEIAVDFLAVLELVHCKQIAIRQDQVFGEISLALRKETTESIYGEV